MEEMEFGNNFHFNQIKYQTSGFENRFARNNKRKKKIGVCLTKVLMYNYWLIDFLSSSISALLYYMYTFFEAWLLNITGLFTISL